MIRSAPPLLFACCLLVAACSGPAAPEADAPAAEPVADVAPRAGTLRERARELRESRGLWWQDDALLESLDIAATEREALRATVQRGQQALDAAGKGAAEANLAYREALAAADLAGARKAAERHAEQVRTLALERHLMVVDVLEGLQETARQRLLQRPGLLAALARVERPDAAGRRPGRGGRGAAQPGTEPDAD